MRPIPPILCLIAIVAAAGATAQEPPSPDCQYSLADAGADVPRFGDFPARGSTPSKLAPVDFKGDPEARRFRARLREGAADGPNFAGNHTIVGWGCGAGCFDWGMVDAITGKVRFEKRLRDIYWGNVGEIWSDKPDGALPMLKFRRDSDLLVLLGAPSEDLKQDGIGFYRWDGKRFARLRFIPRAALCADKATKP